jgi:hypothetical protein
MPSRCSHDDLNCRSLGLERFFVLLSAAIVTRIALTYGHPLSFLGPHLLVLRADIQITAGL